MSKHTQGLWSRMRFAIAACVRGRTEDEQIANAELLSFVRKIAEIGMCSDEEQKNECRLESGPYCGAHGDLMLDDEITEARALLAKAEGR